MVVAVAPQVLQQLGGPHAHASGALEQGLGDEGGKAAPVLVEEGAQVRPRRGELGVPATQVRRQLPAGILGHLQALAG